NRGYHEKRGTSTTMSRTWDITEDVFSANDVVTSPQSSDSKPIGEVSSLRQFAVAVSLTAAAAVASSTVTAPAGFDGTSDVRVVVDRVSVPLRRPPDREKRPGIDFVRGRSPEKLARSFGMYFRPSTLIDDSSDEGYVFE